MVQFTHADWNQYARWYDSLNELRPYREMLKDVTACLETSFSHILDAGCGTGNLVKKLHHPHGKLIVGLDTSREMLRRAQLKSVDAQFVQASLDTRIPFAAYTFDTITCVNALYAVRNPRVTLMEFYRVLQPEGKLVIVTPKFGYENGLILKSHCRSEKPDSYWIDVHKDPKREATLLREAIRNEQLERRFLWIANFNRKIAKELSFHFFSLADLMNLVKESGFIGIEVRHTYAEQNLLLIATRK